MLLLFLRKYAIIFEYKSKKKTIAFSINRQNTTKGRLIS